jgi:hypothetical protein
MISKVEVLNKNISVGWGEVEAGNIVFNETSNYLCIKTFVGSCVILAELNNPYPEVNAGAIIPESQIPNVDIFTVYPKGTEILITL